MREIASYPVCFFPAARHETCYREQGSGRGDYIYPTQLNIRVTSERLGGMRLQTAMIDAMLLLKRARVCKAQSGSIIRNFEQFFYRACPHICCAPHEPPLFTEIFGSCGLSAFAFRPKFSLSA